MTKVNLDKKIIGFALNDNEAFAKCISELSKDHFEGSYKTIFSLVSSYKKKFQKKPSAKVLEELIKRPANAAKFKNPQDVISTIQLAAREKTNKDDFNFYVSEIKNRRDEYLLREVLPKAAQMIKNGQNPYEAWTEIKKAGKAIELNNAPDTIIRTTNKDIGDNLKKKYEDIKANPEKAWGVRTGYLTLDNATFGLHGGELLVVAGRHGSGKSVLLLNMAIHAFNTGKNVLLLSLEMPTEQYWYRIMSRQTRLPIGKIQSAKLAPEQEKKYMESIDEVGGKKNWLEIIDTPKCTPLTVEAELEAAIDKFQPDIVFIDYLGIMKADEATRSDHEDQAKVVEGIRSIARIFRIPVATAVQLNRETGVKTAKNKTKSTERLSRSDVIGATADVVLQIEEADIEDDLAAMSSELIVQTVKNRKGPIVKLTLYKDFEKMLIEDFNQEFTKKEIV